MKKILLLFLLGGFLLYSSCNKEEEKGDSTLTIDVNFTYGDEPFVINQVYEYYPLNYALKIEKLMLYISEVRLLDSDGVSHAFSDILFVDASDGVSSFSATIPEGNYSMLDFSIGVPQAMNGTQNPDFDAALYDPNHPLSLSNGMYWTWNTGYRFVLIDGRCNTDPMIDQDFETLLSIHTGKDYCFRNKSLDLNYTAVKDGSGKITLTFDVHGFLASANDVIDIAIDNQSHGTNEDLANRVSDNVILSIENN